jgi:hypothetical protein
MDKSNILVSDIGPMIQEIKSESYTDSDSETDSNSESEKKFYIEKLKHTNNIDNIIDKSIEELKDMYKNYKNKNRYIKYIIKYTNLSEERLKKWDYQRVYNKYENIYNEEKTKELLISLKKYGDGFSNKLTPLGVLKQRLYFLNKEGIVKDNDIRYDITRKLSIILKKNNQRVYYKRFMIIDIDELENLYKDTKKKYHRENLIEYLLKHGYTKKFLKSKKDYILEYLKSDIKKHALGSRGELIKLLSDKQIWSRNTLRNWDMERLKNTYIKYIQDNYSPLSSYKNNSTIEYLEDFNNLLLYVKGV